jgi:cytidylate kinase
MTAAFPEDLIITISGPAGSGKSHCATRIAQRFGIPCHSAGSVFRTMAAERGVPVVEFSKIAEADPEIDREVDRRTADLAKKGASVMEGRLVAWFSGRERRLSFYLTAPFEERARRIAERESISLKDASFRTRAREASERRRYKKLYSLDISDLSSYDFVINTAKWDKEAIIDLLESIISLHIKHGGP